MSEERKFKGVWIPASIWFDKNLSITEKVMLIEIDSLENPKKGCFKSNEKFAEFFGLSKSRVSEIISSLVAKDLVRVVLIREGKQIVGRQIWMTDNGRLLTGSAPSSENTDTSSENTHTPLRKRRRPSSEKAATLFGKGGDPSSEKAIESNTDSSNTSSNTESNTELLAPDESGAPKEKPPALTDETFFAFSDAYFLRYGINPIRDAKVNGTIANFIKRVGKEDAPHIAAFYVRHNDSHYVRKQHPIGMLYADAEGLRTQWATGRTMTATRAAQIDGTATNANAVNEAIEMWKRREKNAAI